MNRRTTFLLGLLWLLTAWLPLSAADPIAASPHLPATIPWDLQQLSQAPEFQWLDTASPVHSLMYQGEPYNGHATRVFAYYASPRTLSNAEDSTSNVASEEKFPAVVLIHGGGGTAFAEWAELWARRGYAAIAMDLAGYQPKAGTNAHRRENRDRLPDGGPDQGDGEKFGSIDKPVSEQWPYHAVANVLRAHSLIRSFAEVDPLRTAVTGISWGGYLTCIVAGVDSRFDAAVPVYGCGFLYENSMWLEQFGNMQPAQRERWIQLWDPSRYLPAVTMPILFVNGTNDFAYPLDSYMKSFDAVPGEKQLRVTVNMPHGHPPGWAPQEIGWFVDHHLRDEPALPSLAQPRIEDGRVRLEARGPLMLMQATLHFTTDSGPINKRSWQDRAAMIEASTITAEAPPAEATAWFATVTDQRGALVSSRIVLP